MSNTATAFITIFVNTKTKRAYFKKDIDSEAIPIWLELVSENEMPDHLVEFIKAVDKAKKVFISNNGLTESN